MSALHVPAYPRAVYAVRTGRATAAERADAESGQEEQSCGGVRSGRQEELDGIGCGEHACRCFWGRHDWRRRRRAR